MTIYAGQRVTAAMLNLLFNPPRFRIEQHTPQSVPNVTNQQIFCESVIYDTASGVQRTSPYSYVVPAGCAGTWELHGGVGWNTSTTGARYAMIWVNGAELTGAAATSVPISAAHLDETGATIDLAVGDQVQLYGFHLAGTALNTTGGGGQSSFLEGRLVAPA